MRVMRARSPETHAESSPPYLAAETAGVLRG